MKSNIYLFSFLITIVVISSCNDNDKDNESLYNLTVNKSHIIFDNPLKRQNSSFIVQSDIEWEIEAKDKSWLEFHKVPLDDKKTAIYISTIENTTGEKRSTELLIKQKNKNIVSKVILIEQLGQQGENILEKIPDKNFKEYLIYNFFKSGFATQGDASEIFVINCDNKNIISLDGIEYFNELLALNCSSNSLDFLDFSKNPQLLYLDCSINNLITLDISQNSKINYVDCSFNRLTILNLTCNKLLQKLNCDNNNWGEKQVKILRSVYNRAMLNPSKNNIIYNIIED